MAKSVITNGQSGLDARNALNGNFTELYTGANTHAATGKTTPVDADEIGVIDSAASNILKKLTWANIKATLKAYFDTLYAAAGVGGPQVPAWTWTDGSITTKSFNTNSSTVDPTTSITLFRDVLGQFGDFWELIPVGVIMVLLDSNGASFAAKVTAINNNANDAVLTIAWLGGTGVGISGSWGGAYTFSFLPGFQTPSQIGAATSAQGALADSALQPDDDGSGLTGITASQVGAASAAQGAAADSALQPGGNGSGLTGLAVTQLPRATGFAAPESAGNAGTTLTNYAAVNFATIDPTNIGLNGLSTQVAELTDQVQALLTKFRADLIPGT